MPTWLLLVIAAALLVCWYACAPLLKRWLGGG
jgi:hypothetical protein